MEKQKEEQTMEDDRLQNLDLQMKERERLCQSEIGEIKVQKGEILADRAALFNEKEQWQQERERSLQLDQ